jgi:protein SCO1/2
MIDFRKAGLLIVTLVIPALIFIFLKFFATNHYDLPHYFPVYDTAGKVIINGGDTLFYKVPSINLKDTSGSFITREFGNGKITVAGYLPENCLNTCQIVLGQSERILALKENIPNLNLLTLADHWTGAKDIYPQSLNTKDWQVLTGSDEEVKRAWDSTLKLLTEVPGAKTNSLETKLVLIDADGHIRGYYNASDLEETNRLMAEIKILDYEKKRK